MAWDQSQDDYREFIKEMDEIGVLMLEEHKRLVDEGRKPPETDFDNLPF